MNISCTSDVFSRFPEAQVHGLIAQDLRSFDTGVVGDWRQRAIEHVAAATINAKLLSLEPEIKAWRDAYQRFGLKPSKFRSSIEQLYKRALKGDMLTTPIALVNLYCYISIVNKVPAGAYDLSSVEGSIKVRLSSEGETFQPIGERTAIPAQAGVVCYADDAGIICYGWNYRDSQRTCLQTSTDRAIFFIDTVNAAMSGLGSQAVRDLATALNRGGAVVTDEFCLSADSPRHMTE